MVDLLTNGTGLRVVVERGPVSLKDEAVAAGVPPPTTDRDDDEFLRQVADDMAEERSRQARRRVEVGDILGLSADERHRLAELSAGDPGVDPLLTVAVGTPRPVHASCHHP